MLLYVLLYCSESQHVVLPDTRWHHIVMNFRNCTLFKYIDKMPLYAERSICSLTNVSRIVMKSGNSKIHEND